MNGSPNVVWMCVTVGILLQLMYMVLPLQPWDWARFLGAAVLPCVLLASNDKSAVAPNDALMLYGIFTFAFALIFQKRILPSLGEGTILMWTTVLICVIIELYTWRSIWSYAGLAVGSCVLCLLIVPRALPYVLKIVVYAWFLMTVVAMGVLQFRQSDFALIALGRVHELDYRLALIDGMAGAYIGVHVTFLYELLPIPGKGEQWADFKIRWRNYLNLLASRIDDQRFSKSAAVGLVVGIVVVAYTNHALGVLPDRALANLLLVALPIVCIRLSFFRTRLNAASASFVPASTDSSDSAKLASGIGRARHSRKHRQ